MKRSAVFLSILSAMLLSASACSIRAGGDAKTAFSDGSSKYEQAIPDNITEPYLPSKDLLSSKNSRDTESSSPDEYSSPESQQTVSDEDSYSDSSDYVVISYNSNEPEPSYYESSEPEPSYYESSEPEPSYYESSEPEPSYPESSDPEQSYPEQSYPESSYEDVSEPFEESSSEQSEEESSMPDIPADNTDMTEIKPMLDSFTLIMNEDINADGYIIQYSKNRSFSPENTVTVSTTETTFTADNLQQGEEFFVRYCSYKSDKHNKSYSEWSSTRYVKLREMTTVDGVTYIDGVLIVNKTYSLPADYGSGLTDKTITAFNEMVSAAAEAGITLWIVSGFRSYETQRNTYSYFVSDRGVEQADRASARPGHSEHQTGLAIDVNTTSDYFANTPEAEWLKENCYKYGFIIRYPEGKEEITGYKYEPWHIRYVGEGKAEKITKSGLTLEEYYGITSQYQEQQ